jgi:chromatin remodeling complex protein RSC6
MPVEGGKPKTVRKKRTGVAKNNALMKPMKISAELEAVVGKGPMARSQVIKKIWDYIKKHGLQDKVNKRNINPDALLGKVIGHSTITMFEMVKRISKHIHKE